MRWHIHFYSRKRFGAWPDLPNLTGEDISRIQARFRTGVDVWIIQTCLQLAPALRQMGHKVTASPEVPAGSLLIAHRDDLGTLFSGLHRCFIVCVRADRAPAPVAHVEILQNGLDLAREHEIFLPSWPQPGLIPRDAAREGQMLRMAYFGRQDSLPHWFSDTEFLEQLVARQISFEIRHKAWHDYHDIDLVLAHRTEAPTMLRQKPGTKLCNAWLAGVPALLSPEPEYQRLREHPDDFIEIESPADVLAAIDMLRVDPRRYAAMRARCAVRAPAFRAEAVAERWLEALTGFVGEQYMHWQACGTRSWFAHAWRLRAQKAASAVFRAQIAEELKRMNAPAPVRLREPAVVSQKH
ncbi:MAG: hypothetical protein CGU28_04555 [Candidatus Dactylopiibacterium carminicum]|nr:MAG: hypothetical protein CGU28_04555 [Candidatus Dactylopiibacterium carminicum]